jgi:hypothetical protein
MKIFVALMIAVKTWELDRIRCLGFNFDGAFIMVEKNNGIATLLKNGSPFITSTHCIANRTNLTALEASNNPSCKKLYVEINTLINDLASHFKKLYKKISFVIIKKNSLNIL